VKFSLPCPEITGTGSLVCHKLSPSWDHISILEQEFERRAITVFSFSVLALEFNVESKNMNRFAGERHDFFCQNSKGVPH